MNIGCIKRDSEKAEAQTQKNEPFCHRLQDAPRLLLYVDKTWS